MSLIWKWSEVVGHARGDVQQADLSSDLKVKMNLRLDVGGSAGRNKWAPHWDGE